MRSHNKLSFAIREKNENFGIFGISPRSGKNDGDSERPGDHIIKRPGVPIFSFSFHKLVGWLIPLSDNQSVRASLHDGRGRVWFKPHYFFPRKHVFFVLIFLKK